jgi:GNAT superfamily N-acetyltransferase
MSYPVSDLAGIGENANALDKLVTVGSFVSGIVVVGFILVQLLPAWILLARSLPQEGLHRGSVHRYWQALLTVFEILLRGAQTRSLRKAARLRIEIELLNPPPARPRLLNYNNRAEYPAAVKEWSKEKSAWSRHTKSLLRALVEEEEADRSIDVDTCSPLIDNDGIDRYFNALASQSHHTNQRPMFLSKVTIRSGFVAPLHLLTGVLARYEEDWQPLVEGYGRSVIRQGDAFRYSQARKVQAFIFDCWLLWGPSIPVCTCPEWHGEVALQYGFGDEDNSLSLRCSSPEILRLFEGKNNSQLDGLAWQTRVSGTLKWGPGLGDTGFCPAQRAIWHDKRLVLDIADQPNGIRRAGGTEEQVFALYYSAYLWITFVMCAADTSEPLNPDHQWRDLIPFFMHGNVADGETYDFHATQLARAAVEGALQLLCAEPDLVLRFACAIDETACGYDMLYSMPAEMTIRNKMIKFVQEAHDENRLTLSRLKLDFEATGPLKDGDYSACALPGIVTDYYNEGDDGMLAFHELRVTRKTDIDLLRRFYDDCFVPEFPNRNERESFENIKRYLDHKESGWFGKNNYHVVVVLDGDQPVGGSICDYLVEPNAGVIEYLVIQPGHRGTGLGGHLLEHTERLLHQDADKGRGRPLDWILGEMDDPYIAPAPTNRFDPFTRVRVWHNWGYRMLDFPYVQPALASDKSAVRTLLLMAKTCSPRFTDSVPSTDVRSFLREYLVWAMRIAVAEDNKAFEEMCEFLPMGASVRLIRFSDYLGWGKEAHLHVKEVLNAQDPELDEAIAVYEEAFTDRGTAIASCEFRKAFQTDGLAYRPGYRYHLWTIKGDAEAKCQGVASFLTMPSAGFGGYLTLIKPLRGSGKLRHLAACIEERMVRDGTDARGWYLECDGPTERDIFLRLGFCELDVDYGQPSLPGAGADQPSRPLHLLYKPFGRVYRNANDASRVTNPGLLQAVREIYQSIYDIPKPDESEAFIRLAESVQGEAVVKAKPVLLTA